ncbi:MAG TPA: LuxR C-terminal-related transcriptional regulator [Actinomycetota bacterium]|nr:LuxR C-terminal-related transcriptional regulator [Actinomycetota bacterium]
MGESNAAIVRGREALARGAWADAYDALHAVDASALTPSDLEALADAAWWTSRFPESLELRTKAYAACAAEGDDLGAAGIAARLAIEHFVRDEHSVGAGFLMRARRHAEAVPEDAEHGFLLMVEATVARFSGDTDGAARLADRAVAIGQRTGSRDLVAMSLHTKGLALIEAGRVAEGLPLMDEAMAAVVAGDLSPYFTGIIYCALIGACLELSDVRRAGEWSDAARVWCESLPSSAPFPGMCRINRAEVARLQGLWTEAETEAVRALAELEPVEPGLAASALVQVGEIRRRTGDLAGAEEAFVRAQELGADPQPGLALLRLAQGRVEPARAALRLALTAERVPARRVRLLAADVRAAIAAGALDEARAEADELAAIAAETGLPAFDAAATTAAGEVRLAQGDVSAALERLRHAIDACQALRLPYETAVSRALYGRALGEGGDEDGSRAELRAALGAFQRLGARLDAEATARLLGEPHAPPSGLTPREMEVLRLVAAGKTNRDIAVELVISEHTVARHLQNMFAKLGVSSRAAATAYAYEHGLA